METLVRGVDRLLGWFENGIVIAIVTVMVVLAFSQVVLRNVFQEGFLWGEIFLRHLVLWVGFLGASMATRQNKHIRIDLMKRYTPPGLMKWVATVIDLVTMFICGVLAKAGWEFLQAEIEYETILFNEVPAWPFQLIIPIGFALIGFRFFLKILERFLGIEQEEPDEFTPESIH
ncbi:MAG: TRAP transporter small permease [Calditrichota bacterium]|mgnify:CR=1 FL=1